MRLRSFYLIIAPTMLLAACGSDAVTRPQGPEGTYDLETVNGVNLPFLKEQSASDRTEVVSGSLWLRTDGTYRGEIVERWTSGANAEVMSKYSNGTFAVAENRVTFNESASGAVYHGTINGTRVSATLSDVTFGFIKR